MLKKEKLLIALAAGVGVAAVTYKLLSSKDIPEGAVPVKPFDLDRYLGKWYEIARLPNRIEKNIRRLTEEYGYDEYDNLKVITRGFNINDGEWKEVTGKIKFAGDPDVGMLKVSYFGPFYASYNILDLDKGYQYALVSGSSVDYLWILSRETTIPEPIKRQFLSTARRFGFAVEKLEWV